MSIASKLTTIDTALGDIKSAIINKGVTPSGNITTYATAIGSISGGGSAVIDSLSITPSTSSQTITASGGVDGYSPITVSAVDSSIDSNISAGNIKSGVSILGVTGTYTGSGGKYKIGDRIKPDGTGATIGTVCGFTRLSGGTGRDYAVVCLDATFRLASGNWATTTGAVSGITTYSTINTAGFGMSEYATQNCSYIGGSGKNSTAINHCRSKSFTIDGTTYYGVLPTICELQQIFAFHYALNQLDTTASSAGSTLNFTPWKNAWSCSQQSPNNGWYVNSSGVPSNASKATNFLVIPVLEIPN